MSAIPLIAITHCYFKDFSVYHPFEGYLFFIVANWYLIIIFIFLCVFQFGIVDQYRFILFILLFRHPVPPEFVGQSLSLYLINSLVLSLQTQPVWPHLPLDSS